MLSVNEIAYPIRAFFRRQKNAEFYYGEVVDFKLDEKKLVTDKGEVSYEMCIRDSFSYSKISIGLYKFTK